MIDQKCFTKEWIAAKAEELKYPDVNLLEKTIHAFSLLDMLARSGCTFKFKGGSCIMLLLKDMPHRLSIDIDIICPLGTNIEDYLKQYKAHGFIDYRLIDRKQRSTEIPKSHSKFFYQVAFKDNGTGYILLDVLYENCHYQQIEHIPIENILIENLESPAIVDVPSIGDILGDKLTAYAPETTGIPYYKNDKPATLEIIKQLFDIGRLFDHVTDLTITRNAFFEIAPIELSYRNLDIDDTFIILKDIRNTSLNISTRGLIDKEKFDLLQKGIKSISSFMYRQKYHLEDAIVDASKAAYLSALLENGINEIQHYDNHPSSIGGMKIERVLPSKLNKLKMGNPEAFFYWALTDEVLANLKS
jgi:hypothetical protein